jgi:SAM-dependent methyltransferase
MIEYPVSEIKVEELMEKIRAEIDRRKAIAETNGEVDAFNLPRFQSEIPPEIDGLQIEPMPEHSSFEKEMGKYHISDFLKYHDIDFLINGYRGILKRKPDLGALEYFSENLRSGTMTKAEILGRLRYSPEGRRRKTKVKGLFSNFVIQSSFRIPVLGYFFSLVSGVVNLPIMIRKFSILETNAFGNFRSLRTYINDNSTKIQLKINEIITAYGALKVIADRKVDKIEVASLRSELLDLLASKIDREKSMVLSEKKADRDEVASLVESLRGEVQGLLSGKIDREESMVLSEKKADRDEVASLVESLRGEVQGLNDSKADRTILEEFEKKKVDRDAIEALSTKIHDFRHQMQDHKRNILDQQRRLSLFLEEARKRLPEPLSSGQIQNILAEEDHLLDAMYVSFEDRFRGTRREIKKGLEAYLPVMAEAHVGVADSLILDVGCGRGEWLELCRENNLKAMGVDINRQMIAACKGRGLDVTEADAVSFLREKGDNSFGAVCGFQFVEHIPLNVLIALFDEALRVIKPRGVAVFETPNPQNLIVGACNFYTDPSHKQPIPAHTLHYMMEARGFIDIERISIPVEPVELGHPYLQAFFNEWVNISPDYAVIGRKA